MRVVLAWVVGGTALWAASGTGVALVLAAMIGRSHVPCGATRSVVVPAQRTASPSGPRSQPHLPCAGAGRSTGAR